MKNTNKALNGSQISAAPLLARLKLRKKTIQLGLNQAVISDSSTSGKEVREIESFLHISRQNK